MDKKSVTQIQNALEAVQDPELPAVSIVELGMVHDVRKEEGRLLIELLPTFSGCPALSLIEEEVKKAVQPYVTTEPVDVKFVYDPPWTTERITENGRKKLKEYGIAPPPPLRKEGEPWHIECPYCGSTWTTMENLFGPTACRSILYCTSCKNPFEAMKPVANV